MKSIVFMVILFFSSQANAEHSLLLGKEYNWTFTGADKLTQPIQVDLALSNQVKSKCCEGNYEIQLDFDELSRKQPVSSPGIYIPAIGGLKSISVGKNVYDFSGSDYSSVGPLIPIGSSDLVDGKLNVTVSVWGPSTDFSGIWKTPPIFGNFVYLSKLRDNDNYYQHVLPLLDSTVLFIFSMLFFLIAMSLKKKNDIYKQFGVSLLSWSVFYFFLSGYFRSISYYYGSILHYPSRILACFGLTLVLQRMNREIGLNKKILYGFFCFFVLNLTLGFFNMPVVQKLALIPPSFLAFYPFLSFSWKKSDLIGRAIFILGAISFCGQISDCFKLFFETRGIYLNVPFLNRVTFLPLLVVSFGDCIIQFSSSFHNLRIHLFRVKSYAKTILYSAKEGLSHDNIHYFLKATSKISNFCRVSLSQRQDDGSYKVIRLFGSKFTAEGSILNLERNLKIESAVSTGKVVFGEVSYISEGWNTTSFSVVPIPETPNPPYLLLLSDPKSKNISISDIAPYLSQISSTIWTNLERAKEQYLRLQTEKKFSSLVKQLDPSLYEFITRNIDKVEDADMLLSSTRGIVFFDQKGYSTLTENLDDASLARYAQIVGVWVTQASAKYGARVSSFAGDAFLLEVFSIGSESIDLIAQRTVNLVWMLALTLGELNQILLKEGFSPITFRFGAHIGKVTGVNLDFINKGLSNSIGDTVNVAARLQSLAKGGSIYISGELAYYCQTKFITRLVPKQFVKGRQKMVEIHELIGKSESEGGLVA